MSVSEKTFTINKIFSDYLFHSIGYESNSLERHDRNDAIFLVFFAEAYAQIDGPKEKFIKAGSALVLNCTFQKLTQPPDYVFW